MSAKGSENTNAADKDAEHIVPAEVSENDSTKPVEETKVVNEESSNTGYRENSDMKYSPSQQEQEEQQSVSTKAKEAGQSFKDMMKSLGRKAIAKTEEKTRELKDKSAETVGIGPQKDARDIKALKTYADNIVMVFEQTMAEIGREDYESQERLLTGYKKLLEEQINVINS
ncbi:MAG: hypothetical protein ACJ71E_08455, partial [Nitrososphaeraceae archaeon]